MKRFSLISMTLLLSLVSLSPTDALGEGGYPDRTGITSREGDYYNGQIGVNRRTTPQGSKSDAEYAVQVSHLAGSLAPTAPEDSAEANGGTVDRAEKLKDASQLAREGRNAASAQASEMAIALSNGLTDSVSPGASGSTAGSLSAVADAAAKYNEIWKGMDDAQKLNDAGAVRLRYDPSDDPTEREASESFAERLAGHLTPEARAVLEGRGLDPDTTFARLLSGQVDTQDPNAVLEALGDEHRLTDEQKAEASAARAAETAHAPETAEGSSFVEAAERASADAVVVVVDPGVVYVLPTQRVTPAKKRPGPNIFGIARHQFRSFEKKRRGHSS